MNTEKRLLWRLLKLHPIKNVKDYFDLNGKAVDVLDAILQNRYADIKHFAYKHQMLTRQNIHIFKLANNFVFDETSFPLTVEKREMQDGELRLFCLPVVTYEVTLYDPLETVTLDFLQPILIRIKNNQLIIQTTKIEKTVSSYFNVNRKAVRHGQLISEEVNFNVIKTYFQNQVGVSTVDINKGIKKLWEEDIIDAIKVQWRKTSSFAKEVMDESFTLKAKYPEEYARLVTQPLSKTMFKLMVEDADFCSTFEPDPTNGIIGIPKFQNNLNQVENVIDKILNRN